MTIYEQRVKRLRDHVLANQAKKEEVEDATELEDDAETIDYDTTTVSELKELLDKKGIEYNTKARKDELVELLEGAE